MSLPESRTGTSFPRHGHLPLSNVWFISWGSPLALNEQLLLHPLLPVPDTGIGREPIQPPSFGMDRSCITDHQRRKEVVRVVESCNR